MDKISECTPYLAPPPTLIKDQVMYDFGRHFSIFKAQKKKSALNISRKR